MAQFSLVDMKVKLTNIALSILFSIGAAVAVACFPSANAQDMRTIPDSKDPILRHTPIERERIEPTPSPSISNVAPEFGTTDYFLYNYVRRESVGVPIVHLKIPDVFLKKRNKAPIHAWGLNFIIWYPALVAEQNIDELISIPKICLQISCVDEIRVSVDNNIGNGCGRNCEVDILKNNMRLAQENAASNAKFIKKTDVIFDEAYEKKLLNLRDKFGDRLDKEYFIKYTRDGAFLLFIDCSPNTPFPACDAYFWLNNQDQIEVHFFFSKTKMKNVFELHSLLNKLIDGFVHKSIVP